jgi:HK97 family phage portal protein
VVVDRNTVLGYPAVWRCVSLIANKVAGLPLNCYKRTPKGGRAIDLDHRAEWLLDHAPSELYSPFSWKSTMCLSVLLHGNAFSWIKRDPQGRPEELIILDPEKTGISIEDGNLSYYTRIGKASSEMRRILPENVLHWKWLSLDGIAGIDVIGMLRDAFGLGIALARYTSISFRNHGAPGFVVLKFPKPLDKQQAELHRDQWLKMHGGLDNSHKVAIVSGGAEVTPFKIDHDTAQLLELRQHDVACGIANIFGVPAHKLGTPIGTQGYNSLASEEQAFLNDCLEDKLVLIEEECERKLLRPSEQVRGNRFIEFDRRSLIQGDHSVKVDTLLKQLNGGLLTYNQCADELNLPGIGDEGDRLRVASTVTMLDLLGEPMEEDDEPTPSQPVDPAQLLTLVQGEAPKQEGKVPADGYPPGEPPPGRQRLENLHAAELEGLLAYDLKRWLKRVRKATEAAAQRPDFRAWLAKGLDSHEGVLAATLEVVGSDDAAKIVDELRDELGAVTRDQVGAVFDRLEVAKWVKEVLGGD